MNDNVTVLSGGDYERDCNTTSASSKSALHFLEILTGFVNSYAAVAKGFERSLQI